MSGDSLDMLGVEAMAEGMADQVIGHHPIMPDAGKTAQAPSPRVVSKTVCILP